MSNPDIACLREWLAAGAALPRPMPTSPLLAALGAELIAHDPVRRELVMRFSPSDLFRQGAGVVQGGAITAMLDFVLTISAFTRLPQDATVTTTTLNTAFLAPASGSAYRAIAHLDKPGRRIVFASARLIEEDPSSGAGREVAMASASLLVLPLPG